MDNKLVTGDYTALQDALSGIRSGYPAPELLKEIEGKKLNPEYDKSKVDIWAIGLTLIDLALLSRSYIIYDWDSFTVD